MTMLFLEIQHGQEARGKDGLGKSTESCFIACTVYFENVLSRPFRIARDAIFPQVARRDQCPIIELQLSNAIQITSYLIFSAILSPLEIWAVAALFAKEEVMSKIFLLDYFFVIIINFSLFYLLIKKHRVCSIKVDFVQPAVRLPGVVNEGKANHYDFAVRMLSGAMHERFAETARMAFRAERSRWAQLLSRYYIDANEGDYTERYANVVKPLLALSKVSINLRSKVASNLYAWDGYVFSALMNREYIGLYVGLVGIVYITFTVVPRTELPSQINLIFAGMFLLWAMLSLVFHRKKLRVLATWETTVNYEIYSHAPIWYGDPVTNDWVPVTRSDRLRTSTFGVGPDRHLELLIGAFFISALTALQLVT